MGKTKKMMQARRFPFVAMLLCLPLLVTACATDKKDTERKAFEVEELLVPAGFSYHVAKTPAMLARMNKLPAHKMIRYMRHGKPLYLYQDAAGCKCVWVGDEAAYERFKEFFHQAVLARKQEKRLWITRWEASWALEPDKVDDFIDQDLPNF